ncbi:hypothetical protein DFJ77DRAFT_449782 [Powellomyces hirtus]|nr:hypothetical protein DFJ77DRAFT_449782 [Powellomyces hirtus]
MRLCISFFTGGFVLVRTCAYGIYRYFWEVVHLPRTEIRDGREKCKEASLTVVPKMNGKSVFKRINLRKTQKGSGEKATMVRSLGCTTAGMMIDSG